jgi:hypothetical protein
MKRSPLLILERLRESKLHDAPAHCNWVKPYRACLAHSKILGAGLKLYDCGTSPEALFLERIDFSLLKKTS